MIELLLAIGIGSIVLASAAGLYLMGAGAYRKSAVERELAQNGRVAAERITREIRKTTEIAAALPENESEKISEIMFRDSEETEIKYIRYYLEGTMLRRQKKFYYFSSDPNKICVTWNSIGALGESPAIEIEGDEIAAENFLNIGFFGNSLVKMRFVLSKAGISFNLATAALGRNIN